MSLPWDGADTALLVLAGYVAVVSLVRIMLAYRDELAVKMQGELDAQRARQPEEPSAAAPPARRAA